MISGAFYLVIHLPRSPAIALLRETKGKRMKRYTNHFFTVALLCALITTELFADSNTMTYQGRVQSGGSNFAGTGQFKFALGTETNTSRQATANATVSGGFLTLAPITDPGAGYVSAPGVTAVGGGGSGAVLTANVVTGEVASV